MSMSSAQVELGLVGGTREVQRTALPRKHQQLSWAHLLVSSGMSPGALVGSSCV